MSGEHTPCRVNGQFVEPCSTLDRVIDNERVRLLTYTDMQTFKPTRSMVVVRAGDFRKGNGIVMNVCPFCGENISDHIKSAEGESK